MKTYEEMEYSNVSLQFEYTQIQRLIEELVHAGLSVSWKETSKFYTLSVQTSWTTQRLSFNKYGKIYRLRKRNYNIKDQRFANILHKFIQEVKGHAVLKFFSNGQLVVQNIRYGEPFKITQIEGSNKKILYEKECIVSMEEVILAFERNDAELRIPVLRLELDYALAQLFEALSENDQKMIESCKEVIERLRQEMVILEI